MYSYNIFMIRKTKHYENTQFCHIIYTFNVITINILNKLESDFLKYTGRINKQNARKHLKIDKIPYHFKKHIKLQ